MSVRRKPVKTLLAVVSRRFADGVPEGEHAVPPSRKRRRRPRRHRPADRRDQARVFARIVFEVRVLDHHHLAARLGEAAVQRCAFSAVDRLVVDAQLGALPGARKHAGGVPLHLFEQVAGPVPGWRR